MLSSKFPLATDSALATGPVRGLSVWLRSACRKQPSCFGLVQISLVALMALFVLNGAQPGMAAVQSETHTAEHAERSHSKSKTVRHHSTHRKTEARHTTHRTSSKSAHHRRAKAGSTHHAHKSRRRRSAHERARAHQLQHAFVASSQLRPMAQQLIKSHSRAAYAGVLHYARTHTGEASATAYITLGQAYLDDQRYTDAAASFARANRTGHALDDYADYLGARAEFLQQKYAAAEQLLDRFAARHTDSTLIDRATLLLANVKLSEGDPQASLRQLALLKSSALAASSEYLFTLGQASELAGERSQAQQIYTRIYLEYPNSAEAGQVLDRLHKMGIAAPFTVAQRLRHADGLYLAGRYAAAAAGYKDLAQDPAIVGTAQVNDMLAREAVATLKQTHHVDQSQLARLSDTNDEAGATRLYLTVEAARDRNDAAQVKALLDQMAQRFPTSRWRAEALFSAGNMALLAHDLPTAIQYYGELAQNFPKSSMASKCHWRAAWLNYRLGDKKVAAQLFDEQIARYPDDGNLSAALYWRGVIAQEVEKNPAEAAAYYKKLAGTFPHYYYSGLARQRLAALAGVIPAVLPQLGRIPDPTVPVLTDQIPDDDVHVERARLLANAGLNQYIAPEIDASPDSASWGPYAEAELYSSYGENWRALRVMKQKVRSYLSASIDALPRSYWNLLFPQPYWTTLERESGKQSLDPYLVASLIRQESEFNPSVVSYADARGLMQLLPKVGREMARKQHVRGYRTASLLDPQVNIELGTAYFRQLMDEFHGQPEYALAAYNAGDNRVNAWLANGPYASLPEFVESIPFTETRDYVEAILRNRDIYRQLYATPSAKSR